MIKNTVGRHIFIKNNCQFFKNYSVNQPWHLKLEDVVPDIIELYSMGAVQW